MIEVLIIEDDQDIRLGLELLVNGTPGYRCAGAFIDCESAFPTIAKEQPDIILLDIELPGISGIEGLPRIQKLARDANIIMLTNFQDEQKIFGSLCAGATGYLLKSTQPARLLEAIREAHEGGAPMSANIARMVVGSFQHKPNDELTPRENEILAHLCQGKSYKMIADALFISRGTVHSHIKTIYKKLQVNSQSEAVAKAFRNKLL